MAPKENNKAESVATPIISTPIPIAILVPKINGI